MAWITWHRLADGTRVAKVHWRHPQTGVKEAVTLGAVDALTAEVERQRVRQAVEGRPQRQRWLPAPALRAAFLGHLRAKQDRPATLTMYEEVLDPIFGAWAGTPVPRWSRPMLEVYLAQHPGWSPRSVQMRINACRHLIRWAADAGVGCPDFVGRLRAPKVVRREPETWTPSQVAALLRASKEVRGAKYVVPVHLAALAGLSQGDLRTITKGEVDMASGWITRREGRRKTGAPMRVRIVPELAAVLAPVVKGPPAALLLPWFPAKDAALHALHRLCDFANVPRGGWHRWRHSLGARMDAAGYGVGAIGRALAHRPGSTTTLRYIHAGDDQVAAGMEAATALLR